MNENCSPFEVRPNEIAIAETAMNDFQRYARQRSRTDAMDSLIDMHLKHVHQLVHEQMIDAEQGSVIVTDIPNTNLSVVDAHFPMFNERQVGVFTRKGVAVIFTLLRIGHGSIVD